MSKQEEKRKEVDTRFKRQVCFPLYLCAKELTGRYNEVLKEFDLTYTQYIVMNYFWTVGKSNLKDIANAIMLDASTLTPLLKKLEAKGLVEKKHSQKDKRNLEIILTPKGEALRDKTLDVPERVVQTLNVKREDGILLHDLTKHLIDALREGEKKE